MKTELENPAIEARRKLEELGGRTAQDLGLGRIVGQLLVYLYFQPNECSLDQIEADLGLSKAAVSVAARQLDTLGLVKRVWVSGDKRSYYKSADNIATALGNGLLDMLRRRLEYIDNEFKQISEDLESGLKEDAKDSDLQFLADRVQRAQVLQSRLLKLLNSPIVKLMGDKV
jgi:DNA-binding transcriptional regulator GbsR (MarR family)